MQRVDNVVKLIIDYSYKILCNKFNIQYDNNFMNYNDNIQRIFKRSDTLRNSNFDLITQFYNAFKEIVNNYNNSLDNNTKAKLHEILKDSEIETLMEDWKNFIDVYSIKFLELEGDNKIYNYNLLSGNSYVKSEFFTEFVYYHFQDPDSKK